MDNKLMKHLNHKELQYLFEGTIECINIDKFRINTDTHLIYIKNPKIKWEKPYTKPKGSSIKFVDTGDICIFDYQDTGAQLCFTTQTGIEGFPDLDLGTSVILDIEKIKSEDLLKVKNLSTEIKYHTFDFGTGEDIDVTNPDTHLSGKDWRDIFTQGVPTINTENPIILTAEIEVILKDVEKTIEFPIPETNKTMMVEINSTSAYGLVNITMLNSDKSYEKLILSIDALNKSKQLHIDINTDDYEDINVYRNLI